MIRPIDMDEIFYGNTFDEFKGAFDTVVDIDTLIDSDSSIDLEKAKEAYKEDFNKQYKGKLIELVSSLTDNYTQRENQKDKFKSKFFKTIMILFSCITMAPYLLIWIFRDIVTDTTLIYTLIVALIEIISAILVLPKIIAEYLFDKSEGDQTLKILESISKTLDTN